MVINQLFCFLSTPFCHYVFLTLVQTLPALLRGHGLSQASAKTNVGAVTSTVKSLYKCE